MVTKIKFSRETVETLLLNAYSVEKSGVLSGKVGISLTLFELSRYFNDERLENHAFDLFQEALAHEFTKIDLAKGTSGIAYSIDYLIKNQFLDADYFDLYGDKHKEIIESIKAMEYNESESFDYIYYLFFINALRRYIDDKDYNRCSEALVSLINKALDDFERAVDMKTGNRFHIYATVLLSTKYMKNEDFVKKIHRIQKHLEQMDYICQFPLFPLQMYFAGRKEYITLIRLCMNNIIPQTIDFRLKTDLFINLYRLYHIDNSLDYRVIAEDMMKTFINEDMELFENKLYENIIRGNPDSFGTSSGMSRLILLNIFNDKILRGENIELLNL
jgi:hypothetical protein